MKKFHTIYLPTRPQTDTVIAIFILKTLGTNAFPGVEDAEIKILSSIEEGKNEESYLNEGAILIDVGGGMFDHHENGETATYAVVKHLNLLKYPPLSKLIQLADRDDKYGKGIVSVDRLDRAFGLPGLIVSMTKSLSEDPDLVVRTFMPVLWGHFEEEKKRTIELPETFERLKKEGKVEEYPVSYKGKNQLVISIESDDQSMPGWLRAYKRAGLVVQKNSAGHVAVLTRNDIKIDLSSLAAGIRKRELEKRGGDSFLPEELLQSPGRIDQVPQWYYDTATNSLLNGSIHPGDIEATHISLSEFKELLTEVYS